MTLFFKKVKKEPQTVEVMGRQFRCLACNHNLFWLGRSQLNTALATLFNFDWANRSASHVTCEQCGHMAWFKQ